MPSSTDSGGLESSGLDRGIQDLDRAARLWSATRLGAFLLVALGVVGLIEADFRLVIPGLAGAAAFVIAIVFHHRALDRRETLAAERQLRSEEDQRKRSVRRPRPAPVVPADPTPLEEGLRLYAAEPEGAALDPWTADDMDVLPAGSTPDLAAAGPTLFGFLDWSSTTLGARRLRRFLLHPLRDPAAIRRRQDAVREIAKKDAARRDLLRTLFRLRGHPVGGAARFLFEPAPFASRWALLAWAHFLGTAIPVLIAVVAWTGRIQLAAPLTLLVVLSLATIGFHTREGNLARGRHEALFHLLDGFLALEDALRRAALGSAEWLGIMAALAEVRPHSRKLRRRAHLLGFHDYGLFFEAVNALTLWELRILPLADTLLARKRDLLAKAAGALGEAEALVSLALPLAEVEGFEMPEVLAAERPLFAARELGHPLLDPRSAVRNPIALGGETRVLLVTGSNMSGKSTYLKSAGVNLILASIGGPACAAGLRFTPLELHADINVRDSLADGKSYFQVEVERVRRALAAAAASPMALAVFDELFRGTNSAERTAIARAVLRFIASTGALAIVATHDLELAALAAGASGGATAIANRHFRETVEDGRMLFDYRLREGPAPTRNAIRVLEASGYPEEIVSEARRELAGREAAEPERP